MEQATLIPNEGLIEYSIKDIGITVPKVQEATRKFGRDMLTDGLESGELQSCMSCYAEGYRDALKDNATN